MSMSSSSPIPTARGWTPFFSFPESERHLPKHSQKSQKPAPIARVDRSGTMLSEQWELLEKLGAGGMADVYRAFSRIPQRDRVVKVLALGPHACNAGELLERFSRECSVLMRVSHQNLVEAFMFSSPTGGQPAYYVMEHIEGVSLQQLTDLPLPGEKKQHQGGLLAEERALRIMLQICEAVMALHEAGVYHRDLKPGNIMLGQRDGRDHATLIDLGICKCTPVWYAGLEQRTPVEQRFETDPGRDLGTPGFMGAGGNADLVSRDVFGLCATLFKIVLGRTPYQLEPKPGEVLQWRPADDERISESLKSVLERGLRANPAARYPSVARLQEELGYVLQEIADEPIDHGESDRLAGVREDKSAPRDRIDAWILEPVHAALDVARQRLERAAQEGIDGVEAALPVPVSVAAVRERERERKRKRKLELELEPALVDDVGLEASISENEIDGTKAAPLATTVPELEREWEPDAADGEGREGGGVHAASEIDSATAAPLAAGAETAMLDRKPALVGDVGQEAKHGAHEIDGAKATAVAKAVLLEREPTGETAEPRRLVRRIVVGALLCVGIIGLGLGLGLGLGWYFLGGPPRTSIAGSADHATAGIVAERATADAHREAAEDAGADTDADADHAIATPAEITPKEDDARPSGLRGPVAEPTTPAKAKPAKRRALKKARDAALSDARNVLQRCLQNPKNPVTITIGVTASGSLTDVLFSAPKTLRAIEKKCLRVGLKDVPLKAGHARTKHRLQLETSEDEGK